MAYEELKREKDRAVAAKETEIVEPKTRIDELCAEFGDMLKGTLEKYRASVLISQTVTSRRTWARPAAGSRPFRWRKS